MPDHVDRGVRERFVQGDPEALEALFRQFEREVFGWILRIVRDRGAAEDALVETFWRAWRGRARFDPERSVGAWLRRIATNAAIDQLALQRRAGLPAAAVGPVPPPPSDDVEDLRDTIRVAFRRLSPKLKAVAALALIEQRSHAEIAEALDLPIGTVKSRVFRATRALRKELARLGLRA
jgi:RNA polymerase sigma factor (sigma-70 family)